MPLLDYFISKTGQRVVSGLAMTTACGSAAFHTLSNSFFLDKYQNFVQMYRNAIPLEVDPDVMKQANQVLDDSSFTERQRSAFSFFTVLGIDTFHAGSTQLNYGARIGLPRHFAYRSTADIEREDLLIGGEDSATTTAKPFSFNSDTGRALLDSMVLSEQARRFAIAREIHSATTNYAYAHSVLSAFTIMVAYSTGRFINQRFNLYQIRRAFRVGLHSLTFGFGLVTYFMLYDATELAYERRADRVVARMGAEYAAGAVEYYEKQLARNRALRAAMGEAGKKQYTVSGNVEVLFRTRSTPLTVRLDQAREYVEEWAQQNRNATDAGTTTTTTSDQKQQQKQ